MGPTRKPGAPNPLLVKNGEASQYAYADILGPVAHSAVCFVKPVKKHRGKRATGDERRRGPCVASCFSLHPQRVARAPVPSQTAPRVRFHPCGESTQYLSQCMEVPRRPREPTAISPTHSHSACDAGHQPHLVIILRSQKDDGTRLEQGWCC